MTFALQVQVARGDDASDKVLEAYKASDIPARQKDNGTGVSAIDLVEAAAEAAAAIVGYLGLHWSVAQVIISGHANPGHGPRDGWAHEMLNVGVSVLTYQPGDTQ